MYFYALVPDTSFSQLLYISLKNFILKKAFIFKKTFKSDFSYTEVWFTDQNYKQLEVEDKANITILLLKWKI